MSILMVTGIEGARNCAAVVGKQLGMDVEVAQGRKDALAALRRSEFLAVVVDETLAECDPAAAETNLRARRPGHSPADQLCRLRRGAAHPRDSRRTPPPRAGAGAGPPRRGRGHRSRVEDHGRRPAAALATGAHRRARCPLPVADRLRVVADLAGSLRQQLSAPLAPEQVPHDVHVKSES